ncbi:hypothetical protein [Stakelama tenebrarum]|uniref:Uncharacterized protein n=1 Tax=Stakelama tenebrarum TaxID=2711215 RepID=A0A6G6Y175_9SPHN|nr:hypothetical protein [Sphingosinithalassobacter tenebrarum]QIG78660.1 hypothetical protein G5C33_01895 [Sphingosinithalassobacter tenebrarum]
MISLLLGAALLGASASSQDQPLRYSVARGMDVAELAEQVFGAANPDIREARAYPVWDHTRNPNRVMVIELAEAPSPTEYAGLCRATAKIATFAAVGDSNERDGIVRLDRLEDDPRFGVVAEARQLRRPATANECAALGPALSDGTPSRYFPMEAAPLQADFAVAAIERLVARAGAGQLTVVCETGPFENLLQSDTHLCDDPVRILQLLRFDELDGIWFGSCRHRAAECVSATFRRPIAPRSGSWKVAIQFDLKDADPYGSPPKPGTITNVEMQGYERVD